MPKEIEQQPVITREAWTARFEKAKSFMEESAKQSTKTLIEIAAQHPLSDGKYPNDEFSKRLDLGYKLYVQLKKKGVEVEIYVPGSRHMHEGVADDIPLSDAGVQYLKEEGVPAEIIHGDDLNRRYKGADGTYNSADECFVASSYFKDGGFGKFLVVESPGQLTRKALHYIWFGVFPQQYTVPVLNAFHNPIDEVYKGIPQVRDMDPSAQGNDSVWAKTSRRDRNPDFQ